VTTFADHQIRRLCLDDGLVTPFREEQLQPASYDVRLGDRLMVVDAERRWAPPRPVDLGDPRTLVDLYREFELTSGGYELASGGFVLGHTMEVIDVPTDVSAHVQGKSSIARLGIAIEAAGFIDPGFRGPITLEIFNASPVPVILRPGLPIAQFSFQRLDAVPECPYGHEDLGSHCQGSVSVVGSRYGLGAPTTTAPKQIPYDERHEERPCKAGCGEPFQPGQIYDPTGPYHIGCGRR